MRIPIVVISALLLLTACNSREKNAGNAAETETSDTGQSTASKINPDSTKINDTSFTWTKKDQVKFLKECKAGSEQHLSAEKLDGFCSCMLTQSQKYYRTYREMEHDSNDENDAKILAGCAGFVEQQEDDD